MRRCRRASGRKGKAPIEGVKNLIAVASGKGGVGKTTVAVNLAIALKNMGASVGLLDADVYGPNVPVMLGTTEQPKMLDEKTIIPVQAYGVKMISMGLLNPGDKPLVWRGPMLHSVMQQFLRNVRWGQLDYLIADLPPGTGDVQLSLIQTVAVSGAVVVTTPSVVALADVRKAVEMFRQVHVDILGVVENMSYFACPHCGGKIDVFGHGEGAADGQDVRASVSWRDRNRSANSHRRRYGETGGVARRRCARREEHLRDGAASGGADFGGEFVSAGAGGADSVDRLLNVRWTRRLPGSRETGGPPAVDGDPVAHTQKSLQRVEGAILFRPEIRRSYERSGAAEQRRRCRDHYDQ